MPRHTSGCQTAYTWPIKIILKLKQLTPEHTKTQSHKTLRKFRKIKINLRIVINTFQVRICYWRASDNLSWESFKVIENGTVK